VTSAFRAGPLCVSLALTLAVSGCGGNSSSTKTPASVTAHASSAPLSVTAPTPDLSIVSPRAGAHTGPSLTVRVAVSGTQTGAASRFRYVLDRRLTRFGAARLTFHDLAPGRHRLEVLLASTSAGRATITFTVRAPSPVAITAPAEASPTTTSPPQSPPITTNAPPPPTTTTSPLPPIGGIPQGGGGDGDGDNSGGPSDGDGNM
jgi:hypothetical protein